MCAVEDVRLRWVGHRVRAEIGVVVESTLGVVEGQAISIDAHHRLRHEVPKPVAAVVLKSHGTMSIIPPGPGR